MEYFALLACLTAVIAALAMILYRHQQDVGFLVGIGALYYWSLFGAWYIVIDKTGGFSGKYYHYLETKMFPVALDGSYMLTIVLYGTFIIAVELALLLGLPAVRGRPLPLLAFRHTPVLAMSFAAGLASFYLIQDKIGQAWALNTSAYWYTRSQTDDWFTLHQVLNRAALLPAAIGFATLLAGERTRYFINVRGRFTGLAYAVLLAGMGVFTFILGNKNEIFVALVTGILAYVASAPRVSLIRTGAALAAGLWFLYAIDFFRSIPVADLTHVVSTRWDEATEVGRFVTSSNEAYAGHFSMYGVLSANVEPQFGYSFFALACSIVPRLLWPDRPRDIYLYYSESVGTIQNQGYSLHHATGWYLNFGYAGVPLGGAVFGLVWASCIRARERIGPRSRIPMRVFSVVSPWLLVAYIAPLVRAGPEGYKGLVVEGFLIPLLSLSLACSLNPQRPKPSRARQQADRIASLASPNLSHNPLP